MCKIAVKAVKEAFMFNTYTTDELEIYIGEKIKAFRLLKNLDRQALCRQAGVSLNALKNLENGFGSNLKTFIRVLKALQQEEWLMSLAPKVTINPLHMVKNKPERQRARQKKMKAEEHD